MLDPKRVEDLAEELFWETHPHGALTVVREAWPEGFKAGYLLGHDDARKELMREIEPVIEALKEITGFYRNKFIEDAVMDWDGVIDTALFGLAQFDKIKEKR